MDRCDHGDDMTAFAIQVPTGNRLDDCEGCFVFGSDLTVSGMKNAIVFGVGNDRVIVTAAGITIIGNRSFDDLLREAMLKSF